MEAYWNAAAPHLQARYCHNTLGTKIKIERIGNFKHYAGKTFTASTGLNLMKDDTEADLGSADLMVYMCHDTTSLSGTTGKGYKGVLCEVPNANKYKQSVNEWRQTSVKFGGVNNLYN